MNALRKADAAARDALVKLREHDGGTRYNGDDDEAGERACCLVASWKPHDSDCPHAVAVAEFERLLAALDAAQGEAVVRGRIDEFGELVPATVYFPTPQAPPAAPRVERYGDGVLVHWPEGVEQYVCVGDCVTGNLGSLAVPEAAALVQKWREQANAALRRSGTWNGNDMADRIDDMADELEAMLAAAPAQLPAAAVPEGYAAAIKAVQEMMPPRDFRPSAQVWLTGNQVNELHARLDAAAMLAAARKGVGNEH